MLVLYSYWRSSCSWRVRIALNLKGLDYETRPVHLVKDGGQQLTSKFKEVNPMCQVPTLIHDDEHVLSQSMAIIEYLEEAFPDKTRLIPADLVLRSKVREMCEIINSGTQPLQNLSVLNALSSDAETRKKWAKRWIENGLTSVEQHLKRSHGKFCVGDQITAADCFLTPQVYNAVRFEVNMEQFPVIKEVLENLDPLDAFVKAHPDNQPDSPLSA